MLETGTQSCGWVHVYACVSEHSRAACCRVVDGPKQWWYGFGSGEGGLSGLFSPRLIAKVSGVLSVATDCAISRCG